MILMRNNPYLGWAGGLLTVVTLGLLAACAGGAGANAGRGAATQPGQPPAAATTTRATELADEVGVELRATAEALHPASEQIAWEDGARGADGRWTRSRLLRTGMKYPLVRVDDQLEQPAGAVAPRLLQRLEMVGDHLLVSLRPGRAQGDLAAVLAACGASVRQAKPISGLLLVSFDPSDFATMARVRAALAADPAVRVVEPDFVVHAIDAIPGDPGFSQLWGMHNTGQDGGTADADIDAPEAWGTSTGSRTVLVGVIDTGIDRSHPDLAANMWTNPGESGSRQGNGLDDDGNSYIDDWRGWNFVGETNDPQDDHYHGTHCAGTIGGVGGNGQGVAGVCWQVSLVGLKFLSASGSGTTSDAIEAVLYADRIGCDITSNSWGGGGFSQTLKDAIDQLGAHGRLFVAAAGNSGSDNDAIPQYPASYDCANIIAVGASDRYDQLAYFSCYGATAVDLVAPGVDIYSTKPGATYGLLSGTSMATPHVSGACALLKAVNPSLTATQIKAALLANVDAKPAFAGRCVTGGRLNLDRAVQAVAGPRLVLAAQAATEIGDGDGLLNPGEIAAITVTLSSAGSSSVANARAAISTADPTVAILAGSASCGDLPPGTSATAAFQVRLAAGTATPHAVHLVLTATADGSGPWTFPIDLDYVTSATITGQVTRITGGGAIAGAVVSCSGGAATTAADGSYVLHVGEGTYALTARAAGLVDVVATGVTVPPDAVRDFALGAPDAAVAPASLAFTLDEGGSATQALVIANRGDLDLVWSAQVAAATAAATGQEGVQVIGGPATAATAPAYRVSTSDQPGGPVFVWNDISATGTPVTGLGDDSNAGPFPLGMSFPFYGTAFTSARLCSNGWLSFTSTSTQFSTYPLPSVFAPENLIAGVWRDLSFTAGGTLHVQQINNTFVAQFTNVPLLSSSSTLCTFQIVLQPSGSILLYYRRVDLPTSGTVGVQDGTRTVGQTLAHHQAFLHNDLAVRLTPARDWLSLDPLAGTVAPAAAATLSAVATSEGLGAGVYSAEVRIASNDPDRPLIAVPATLTVVGAPRLVAAGQSFDDSARAPAAGDGDGVVEPGETVELAVVLRNSGSATAAGLAAVLSSTSAHVTIPSGTAAPADIPPGGGATVAFTVAVAATCPNGAALPFSLAVSDGGGRAWTFPVALSARWNCRIAGTVRDAFDSAPLAGVVVSAGGVTTATTASGAYVISGLAASSYNVTAVRTGYSSGSVTVTVPPDGSADLSLVAADLAVAPARLDLAVEQGQRVSAALAVANPGGGPLQFAVVPQAVGGASVAAYSYLTSDQAGGPAHVWSDIRASGTQVTGITSGGNAGPVALGFAFPFYGQDFTTLRISASGWVSFTSAATNATYPYGLPSAYAPENLIAGFWKSSYLGSGTIHYQQVDAGTFVVQYTDLPMDSYYVNERSTFQIVLSADGVIRFHYLRLDRLLVGSVGIQDGTRTRGTSVSYNQSVVRPGMSVRLAPLSPWLTLDPAVGNLLGGGSATVAVLASALDLVPGSYAATAAFTSSAPRRPRMDIPVALTVTAAPVLAATAAVVGDGLIPPAQGDGDGLPEPGETVTVSVGLTNRGSATAAGVSASLSSTSSQVVVTTASATYAAIAPGATVPPQTPFVLAVSPYCPDNTIIPCTIAIRDGSGRSWSEPVSLTVRWSSRFSGTVRDLGTGLPLSGATVSVDYRSLTTSADGRFAFTGLGQTTGTASVAKAGYVTAQRTFSFPGDQTWDVQLGSRVLASSPATCGALLRPGQSTTCAISLAATGSLPVAWSASVTNPVNGFRLTTSDDAGGPAFAWTSIAATGTPLVGLGNDGNLGPFPLGFTLPFYDGSFASVRICANGWVSFTSTATTAYAYSSYLPTWSAPENLVAACLRDLNPALGGSVHYQQTDAGTFVIQYTDVPLASNLSSTSTFQIELRASGDIRLQFLRVATPDYYTLTGLQDATRERGISPGYGRTLHDGMAILLTRNREWLRVAPASGTLAAGASATLAATLDSTGLAQGSYAGEITLTSDDYQRPSRTIPVSFQVVSATAPAVQEISVTTDEDVPAAITLLGSDGDGDALTYRVTAAPQHGTVAVVGGQATYVPARDWSGSDAFAYLASDGAHDSAPATAAITVRALNDAPVARSRRILVQADLAQSFALPVSDVDGDALSVSVATAPAHGQITIAGTSATYAPVRGFTGSDSFVFRASDGRLDSALATITLSVVPASQDWPMVGNGPEHQGYVPRSVGDFTAPVAGWTRTFGQSINQVAVGGGRVFVTPATGGSGSTQAAVALDAGTGNQLWSRNFASVTYLDPPAVDQDGVLIRCSSYPSGTLNHLSASDGAILWQSSYVEYSSARNWAPTIAGNRVWVQGGGASGGFAGFDRTTGMQVFYASGTYQYAWTPTWYDGQIYAWLGSVLSARAAQDGGLAWSLTLPLGNSSTNLNTIPVAADGRVFLFAAGNYPNGALYAVDLATRTIAWSRNLTSYSHYGAPAVGHGQVFLHSQSGVTAFDQVTGETVATYAMPYASASSQQPIITPDALIASVGGSTLIFRLGETTARHTIPYGGHLSLAGRRLFIADGLTLRTYLLGNHAPVSWDVTGTTDKDRPLTLDLGGTDADGEALTWRLATPPAHGSATVAGGRLTYIPASGFVGSEAFQVVASDGGADSVPARVGITVQAFNYPPTVSATAAPARVAGTTCVLTALGGDDEGESGLAYTWSLVSAPPAGGVMFTANGDHAASITTATFTALGDYRLRVTAQDAGGLAASAEVTVTVEQGIAALAVSPATATILLRAQASFTVSGSDQFGQPVAVLPPVAWSVDGAIGSIDADGRFTAGAVGAGAVRATCAGVSAAVPVTVPGNAAPVITAVALAQDPVLGTGVGVEVTATDDQDAAALTFTWSGLAAPSEGGVSFRSNGDHAAGSNHLTFTRAGAYRLHLVVTDADGGTAERDVEVAVTAILGGVAVDPVAATVLLRGSQRFALAGSDQFGQPLAGGLEGAWSLESGLGSIAGDGAYAAPATAAGTAIVRGEAGGFSATAAVTVPANTAPVILGLDAASPVTTAATVLTTLAADDQPESELTYTWAQILAPVGGSASFTDNGLNAARACTAAFTRFGDYHLRVTVSDGDGLAVVSELSLRVLPVLAAIVVDPPAASVLQRGSCRFSARCLDQFGQALVPAPLPTWTIDPGGIGTIDADGAFTAPSDAAGPVVVRASVAGVSGTAVVTVPGNRPPEVLEAVATPAADGTAIDLRVAASDDQPLSELAYSWTLVSAPARAEGTFQPAGASTATTGRVAVTRAGSYTFRVTATDAGGLTGSREVVVVVDQMTASVGLSPAATVLPFGGVQVFTATVSDQFGDAVASPPVVWSLDGAGALDQAGRYTANATLGGSATVTATAGGKAGTATVAALPAATTSSPALPMGGGSDGKGCGLGGGLAALLMACALVLLRRQNWR